MSIFETDEICSEKGGLDVLHPWCISQEILDFVENNYLFYITVWFRNNSFQLYNLYLSKYFCSHFDMFKFYFTQYQIIPFWLCMSSCFSGQSGMKLYRVMQARNYWGDQGELPMTFQVLYLLRRRGEWRKVPGHCCKLISLSLKNYSFDEVTYC